MDGPTASARLAQYLGDELKCLRVDVLGVTKRLCNLRFDLLCERLRQESGLVVTVHHVAQLVAGECVQDRRNARHQNLMKDFAAALRINECTAQFLDVLR